MTAIRYTNKWAAFSDDRRYRYALSRIWGDDMSRRACFLMLNPSTADENVADPTVERCVRRAYAMGYGGLIVLNLFAYRSTDPAALLTADDPIGPENDAYITHFTSVADIVICGWGMHGALRNRGEAVEALLRKNAAIRLKLHVLGLNTNGTPRHPLYIGYSQQPTRWKA